MTMLLTFSVATLFLRYVQHSVRYDYQRRYLLNWLTYQLIVLFSNSVHTGSERPTIGGQSNEPDDFSGSPPPLFVTIYVC